MTMRLFRRNKATNLFLIAVLTMSLAATMVIFSVVDRTVLNPIPIRDAHRIVVIRGAAAPLVGDSLSWWNRAPGLVAMAEVFSGALGLSAKDTVVLVPAAAVSVDFFSVFEAQPEAGRLFSMADVHPGAEPVVIISHRLATRSLSGTENAVGSLARLNGRQYMVIGIMQDSFQFPSLTEAWIPISFAASLTSGAQVQQDLPAGLSGDILIARLRENVSISQAQSQLGVLFDQLKTSFAASRVQFGDGVRVFELREVLVRNHRTAVIALFVAVILLLFIGCVNASNLLLSIYSSREREFAVRMSLGARPRRILSLVFGEIFTLCAISTFLALLVSFWCVRALSLVGPRQIPGITDLHLSIKIVLMSVLLSLVITVLIGLIPALRVIRILPGELLGGNEQIGRTRLGRRWAVWLIGAEISLSVILLAAACVTLRSFFRLTAINPGFEASALLSLRVSLPSENYEEPQRIINTQRAILEKMKTLPAVSAAAVADPLPMSGATGGYLYFDFGSRKPAGQATFFTVSENYWATMGIPVLRGRPFGYEDSQTSSKTLIISSTLARQLWQDKDPVGQFLLIEGERHQRQVVGVVGDVKFSNLSEGAKPQIYFPLSQPFRDYVSKQVYLVIRSAPNSSISAHSLTSTLLSVAKDASWFGPNHVEDMVWQSVSPPRFRTILFTLFATLAMLLAGLGVYGVIASSVSRRTREIGVRMSLGANPKGILTMILRDGLKPAVIGVAVGAFAAFGLNRFISSLLFQVSSNDPLAFTVSAVLLILVALIASAVPAVTASRIAPAKALRHE